jgi:methylthioribose-1-phosphate isomerase
MQAQGKHLTTIWVKEVNNEIVQVIDQRHLPHHLVIEDLSTVQEVMTAIKEMHIRGAPLIGVAAAYGMYLAALQAPAHHPESYLEQAAAQLKATRPTAVNLQWAVDQQLAVMRQETSLAGKIKAAYQQAHRIREEDIANCRQIGLHGVSLLEKISLQKKGERVNILTHCNAGWLACVDFGTATSPIYTAFEKGLNVHVWVDETRPRNQGASLTAWELGQHGVPHTVIVDNAGGHLMQHGLVDVVIVGSDRTTARGDVANKIGTYLKALAARDNGIPFYVALPCSSFDWTIKDGLKEINIEEREASEVKYISGLTDEHDCKRVLITPPDSPASNYGFDVTPARLVNGLITEYGIYEAHETSLQGLKKKLPAG